MATVTEEKQPIATSPATQAKLVDQQIRRTRRELKLVDIAAGLITLSIGVLLFLLTASILEHWVIPGGWGDTARFMLFLVLVGGVAWYSWRTFWPLISRPINPAFAAQVIERGSPSLKNSLLNLLLLRDRRQQLSQRVYQAIEQQAEQRLSDNRVDLSVDRSAILRLGYVLVAVLAVTALYLILSPKNLADSMERLLMPWSASAAPSRVQIVDVSPGDTAIARGERLTINAEILGLATDEPVRLRYSTADGQTVGRDVPMTGSSDGVQFECRLPDRLSASENGGIQQDLTYRIFAGDARSPEYKVSVFARPTLIVDRVRYEYPAYTGFPSREETGSGDISAIEGTKVTLFAQANQEIETAHVDFDANGRHDLLMKSDDRESVVTFPLTLRDDRRTPRYGSYVLRYKTTAGRTNSQPPQYQIEVTPDYAPEISLLAPEEEVLDVSLHEPFTIEVEARDPDFALRDVTILGEVAGRQAVKHNLLDSTHTGRFSSRFTTTPAELNLQVGNVLEYWAVAADNRRPEANVTPTERRKIRVVEREFPEAEQPEDGDQQGPGGGAGDDGGEGDAQEGPGEAAGAGDSSDSAEDAGGEGGAPGEESGEGEQGPAGQQQGAGEGEPSADQQAGDGDSQQQPGEPSEGEDQQPGEAAQPGEDGQPGEPSKVSPEGDDDGTAFERMAEHFDEQEGEPAGDAASPDDSADAAGRDGETTDGAAGDDMAADDLGPDSDGIDGAQQDATDDGTGAEGEPSEQPTAEQQQDATGEEGSDAPGGEMSPEQGDPGAGDSSGEEEGAVGSNERKLTEKTAEGEEHLDLESEEPPSTPEDHTESDSDGGQAGDMTGGGEEGGGQQADEEGTGTAGQQEAADDGAGQAADPGDGETGEQAGEDQLADEATGESSEDQPGAGTEGAPGEAGEQAGAEGEPGGDQPGEGSPADAEADDMPESDDPLDPSTDPATAGQQPDGGGTESGDSAPPPPGETEPGDDPNLEYARQQTDLVLDRLEDQLEKQDVDEKLLEKLGWSEEELRRFVDRWKKLKDEAQSDRASSAGNELDAALRSLGLDPNRRTGFRSQTIQDKLRDYSEAYRGRTPVEYADRVRAYIKGTAIAQDEE